MDPNEKSAASGFGQAAFIAERTLIPYRINFENLGPGSVPTPSQPATAPAQRVEITDQLSPDLDWSTLRFTEFGFGDIVVQVPAQRQSYSTVLPVTYNGTTFDLELDLSFDPASGLVRAVFQSVDPATSLPPDVLTGFLPPEDGTGRGQGHIAFSIQPKAGLPTGTQLRNVALISFDGQDVIATNQVDPHDPAAGTDPTKEALNTIDAGVPSSSVNQLPPTTISSSFTVSWAGDDDVGGSGIASFDIFVSTDGGPFSPWQTRTTATSATYDGQFGRSYQFYSVAHDNVGHFEAPPLVADAQTFVNGPPTISDIADQSTNQNTPTNAIAFTIGDFETAAESLTVTASSSNQTLVADENIVLDGSGANRTLTITPTSNNFGTATITVTISDGSLSASDTFLLTVHNVEICDDLGAGFGTVGAWTYISGAAGGGGHGDDYLYTARGNGENVATWTFNVTPGQYRVAGTWIPHANRASDAPFAILDGATVVDRVRVNQEVAPDDLMDAGSSWEYLGGVVSVTGNSLVVQLSNDANEYVIADAVRVERIGDLPEPPEIEVLADGSNVVDGTGSVDFGSTLAGVPVTRTFTVRNVGLATLNLSGPIVLPAGFSIVSGFGSTSLAFGETTTFQVRMDAAEDGTFGGELSFGNNDSDENPFNFTIGGRVTAVQIVDDLASGFSLQGNWNYISGPAVGGGYGDDYLYRAAGNGSNSARWSFNVGPGQYRVSATWIPHANRASNAPFTIFDGTTPSATVRVNQEQAPDDFSDAGSNWENIGGLHTLLGDTLVVELTNDANEYVIADAVRIERIGGLPAGPEIQVLVDGKDVADDSGSVDFGSTLVGAPVLRTFTVRNVGSTPLMLTEPISVPTGFSIVVSFGSAVLATGQSAHFQVRLDASSGGMFSGQLSFGNDDNDENPFNFNITGSVTAVQIIDDLSPGFSRQGNWSYISGVAGGGGHGDDYLYSAAGDGSSVATWSFTVAPGRYRVSTTWIPHSNRASDSPFTVIDGPVSSTVRVNQEQAPIGFDAAGSTWQDLATEHFVTGNTLVAQLSNDANEYVIADAVRIEWLGLLPSDAEIQVLAGGNEVADGTGSIDFGSTSAGTPVTRIFTVRNVGLSPLTLSEPINVPAGFSVVSGFGATTLATGQSTTFQVRLDANSSGTFSGQLSFGNNDADENPFNFTITGSATAAQIVDDLSPGFSRRGVWHYTAGPAGGGGHGDDYLYAAPGDGSSIATWTFTVAPGQYRVSATWIPHANRASNAPYRIFDGSTELAAVPINQEQLSADYFDAGSSWQNLGNFYTITSNTLIVQLTNAANEYVIADAIRIERLVGGVALASILGDSQAPATDRPLSTSAAFSGENSTGPSAQSVARAAAGLLAISAFQPTSVGSGRESQPTGADLLANSAVRPPLVALNPLTSVDSIYHSAPALPLDGQLRDEWYRPDSAAGMDFGLGKVIDTVTAEEPPHDREVDALFAHVEELMDTLLPDIH